MILLKKKKGCQWPLLYIVPHIFICHTDHGLLRKLLNSTCTVSLQWQNKCIQRKGSVIEILWPGIEI